MIRRGFGALFVLVMLAGVAACEGREIVVFSPAEGGSAGNGGASEIISAGAPGGIGGLPDSGGSGGAASGSGGSGGSAGTAGTGGSADKACQTNDDCDSSSWYCQKQNCGDLSGVCLPSPIVEDPRLMPVCGCDDHITYWNDTLRKSYGVSGSTPGECGPGAKRCLSSDECGPDGTCSHKLRSLSDCGTLGTGQCWIVPTDCTSTDERQDVLPCPQPGPPSPTPVCPTPMTTCQALQSDQPFFRMPSHYQCP